MKNSKKHIADYEFSIGLRLTHWIRAISIVVLSVSGFYLAYVFVSPAITGEPINFMNAKWRAVHQIAGFILIGCFIFKTYLFLGKHPHIQGTYNPLQFASYIFFYIVLFVICLTGLILYVNVYHDGLGGLLYTPMRAIEAWMGGLANVRQIHHIAMWIIFIFVVVHIYMAVFNAIKGKDGAMDAIISGYKFPKEK